MEPDKFWSQVYASPWHNPGFFWLCGALFFGWLAWRVGGLRGFLVLFGLEILADCALTGGLTPIAATSAASTPLSIAFVILGDFRYFVLVEAALAGGFGAAALGRAAGLSLVVPVATAAARLALPAVFTASRPFFLLYESMLFALALAHGAVALRRGAGEARVMARELLLFELTQYGLWALADVALLAGAGAGYALRLVPNAMYYAFFLPFVLWRAPRGEVPR